MESEVKFDYQKALSETPFKTKWIAQQMGKSSETINNWRRGDARPSKVEIEKLQQILNGQIK